VRSKYLNLWYGVENHKKDSHLARTMSIATKTGDKGETSLLGGERVRKTDPRIESYGTIDELNASIGVSLSYLKSAEIVQALSKVQNHLFTIGAELAALTANVPDDLPRLSSKHLLFIEQELTKTEEGLPKQTRFILPKGTKGAAHLHLARTVCRRAERRITECGQKHKINPEVLRYLNRLGDLLFLYARKENPGDEPVTYDQ